MFSFNVRLTRLQPDDGEFDAIVYRCQSFIAGDFQIPLSNDKDLKEKVST